MSSPFQVIPTINPTVESLFEAVTKLAFNMDLITGAAPSKISDTMVPKLLFSQTAPDLKGVSAGTFWLNTGNGQLFVAYPGGVNQQNFQIPLNPNALGWRPCAAATVSPTDVQTSIAVLNGNT